MSIMPNQSPRGSLPTAARGILFWASLIGLASALWRLALKPGGSFVSRFFVILMLALAVFVVWALASLVGRKIGRARPAGPASGPIG